MVDNVIGKPVYDWAALEERAFSFFESEASREASFPDIKKALAVVEWRARKVLERLVKKGKLEKCGTRAWRLKNAPADQVETKSEPKPKAKQTTHVVTPTAVVPGSKELLDWLDRLGGFLGESKVHAPYLVELKKQVRFVEAVKEGVAKLQR
jgi:hypothetical protein